MTPVLKAPYPWPGGKARVADLVWERIGNVDNAIEPFMGSMAWLLRRPADHFHGRYRVETANDLNHYVVNFWRAVQHSPEQVAEFADWPVTEADLHARHKWLVRSREVAEWRDRMRTEPDYFSAKIGGWWVWGQCCWIGGQWCQEGVAHKRQMPQLDCPHGVHRAGSREAPVGSQQVPDLTSGGCGDSASAARGMADQIPELSSGAGRGGHRGRPQLADAFDLGRGIHSGAAELSAQVPRLGARFGQMDGPGVLNPTYGTCDARRAWLVAWIQRLADRLRLLRTCYGHWSRVCDSESTLTRLGTTGVFLDPPYPAHRDDTGEKSRDPHLYATDEGADLDKLRDEVRGWCLKWGGNPEIRVALCCYEGDGYECLAEEGWTVHAWEANGGYANQRRKGKGKAANAKRERIYFSPHCLTPDATKSLFDDCHEPE